MEALFASLVSKYGFDIAAKMLGLDKQTENPKYAISLGNMSFDPVNAAKRGLLNTGIKNVVSGKLSGILGPAAVMGGAFLLARVSTFVVDDVIVNGPNDELAAVLLG